MSAAVNTEPEKQSAIGVGAIFGVEVVPMTQPVIEPVNTISVRNKLTRENFGCFVRDLRWKEWIWNGLLLLRILYFEIQGRPSGRPVLLILADFLV